MATDWEQGAACQEIGPEIFFGDVDTEGATNYRDARRICMACPVRADCLEDAMAREGSAHKEYRGGMWGGLSPKERHALYNQRRRSTASQGAAA